VPYGYQLIRTTTKPSTAKCDLEIYTLFLLAEAKYPGCTRLAEILEGLSHDSVNRFLLRERYDPKDLFDQVKPYLELRGGTLSGDDTIIDKPYSEPFLTELIGYFWSGKHHRVVKGIQLMTLYYEYTQLQELEIPEQGLVVYLKKFGQVKVFWKTFKNEVKRYYIMYLPKVQEIERITRQEFKQFHSIHWGIECYHRAIKQLCGIERFMVRTTDAIKTHFFSAIRAFTQLELMRAEELIENWYEVQRNLSLQVARDFILEHLKKRVGLHAHNQFPVNA
jgi:hypothetical protein